jgi:hypothetical protein
MKRELYDAKHMCAYKAEMHVTDVSQKENIERCSRMPFHTKETATNGVHCPEHISGIGLSFEVDFRT